MQGLCVCEYPPQSPTTTCITQPHIPYARSTEAGECPLKTQSPTCTCILQQCRATRKPLNPTSRYVRGGGQLRSHRQVMAGAHLGCFVCHLNSQSPACTISLRGQLTCAARVLQAHHWWCTTTGGQVSGAQERGCSPRAAIQATQDFQDLGPEP